ncbi:UDP-glucose--hexose-1-phosphate uridylyltransferase [Roseateles asaccharophilus]|uniref:Galactose-1-phosphate uridylyltransferase n=1 Tax=Roseateles asaccharophilus TaxID=582607 RepID=A0ABU2ADP8_9BURK|nr:UDP-glucose--hexose-1-phosphate uridylyltransferase [Roseateles asaccharophilus]MDR7335333.1 UDPglucose--hexose-1-phosphate uridylyltransferase [Roseateles asaccharophilus]
MSSAISTEHVHRRRNPLTGRHVLVSPHRTQRPWQGAQEPVDDARLPAHDATCYLCAGNVRANGQRNPDYRDTFVFTNDFAALQPDAVEMPAAEPGSLMQPEAVAGECRVLCFSANHSLTLPEMDLPALRAVVQAWQAQSADMGRRWRWVQVFENKGAAMGCSNPHPHGQIWGLDALPDEALLADGHQRDYLATHGEPLLVRYARDERAAGERVVVETEHWLSVVPYWAAWPFETLLLPKAHTLRLEALSAAQADDLALAVKRLTTRYDNLFQCSFPYSMGWHGAPHQAGRADDSAHQHWQLHAHFYPPLLRSASVRKFMVGFEMLGEAQRDLTPEVAAQRLRGVSDSLHYRQARTA